MPSEAERLHRLFMDLVRVAGLLQPDQKVPGQSLSMSQAYAVHELDRGEPLSQQELGERLFLEKSTVSRMVAALETKGLVKRERDPSNRRTYRLRLTNPGRALHRRVAAAYDGHFDQWAAAMTPAERKALLVGLPALIRVVRETPPG